MRKTRQAPHNAGAGTVLSGESRREGTGEIRRLLVLGAVLALMCTLLSYPGIFYSDSYVRVETGRAVLNSIVKTLTGHRFILETDNAFTVIPSFFMALSFGLTGHVALYTFAQSFSLFAAVFLLIRELNPPGRRLLTALFALSPLVYGASVYYEANVGCAAGIILLAILLRKDREPGTKRGRAAEFLLAAFASFVIVGYRTNALTVIPVFAAWVWTTRKTVIRKLLPLLAVAAGIAMTWLVPWIFGVRGESNASTGFVWEILTTIQHMEGEDRAAYRDFLDEIGGKGATEEALRTSGESTVDGFMWGSAFNTTTLSRPGATGRILRKYFQLMTERPGDFFRTKLDFVLRAMGAGRMLELDEYDYNRWNRMGEYGFNDSLQRQDFHRSWLTANNLLGFYTRRPWVAFLVSAVMVAAEYLRKSESRRFCLFLLLLAVFSYGAYLLVITVFQTRMFYPALLLMMILDASVLAGWLAAGYRRVREILRGRKTPAEKG